MTPAQTRATPLPPDERRAAIIAAAVPLVCDHGNSVTTREIAEAAGIAEGTIFRVFPDKDAVISAVVASVLDPAPYVAELRLIDPFDHLELVLAQAVDAMRRRLHSVWQIMWMLRMSGPPGNERDTSKFVVVKGSPALSPDTRPDMTEATNTLAALLEPHGDQLRLSPLEAARIFRLVTFSSAHPSITDGQMLTTTEIVELLLHGISSRGLTDQKFSSDRSSLGTDSSVGQGPADPVRRHQAGRDPEASTAPVTTHAQPVGAP